MGVDKIVKQSRRLSRTPPPAIRRVLTQVGIVYSVSILFALWGFIDVPWSYYNSAEKVFGSPKGGPFSEMGATAMLGSTTLIPMIYVIGIRVRISQKKLLQKEGKTRVLYMFFERIIVVFIAMYFPGAGLNIALSSVKMPTKFLCEWATHLLVALQALITLYVVS